MLVTMLFPCLFLVFFNWVLCSPARKRTKVVYFYNSPPLAPDHYDRNPPDILLALADQAYLQSLPEKFRAFLSIFRPCWMGHVYGLIYINEKGFQLLNWSRNPIVQALDAKVHMAFLNQLIRSKSDFNSEILEFFQEYINYIIFDRSDAFKISTEDLTHLIVSAIKLNDPDLVSCCIKAVNSTLPSWALHQAFSELVSVVSAKNIDLNNTRSLSSLAWMHIFHSFCRNFGPVRRSNSDNFLVFSIQPVLASIAQHNPTGFLAEVALLGRNLNLIHISYWVCIFLNRDEWIKSPLKADLIVLKSLADVLFTYFLHLSEMNIPDLMMFFVSNNFFALPQLFIMHSQAFRESLTLTSDQFSLLDRYLDFAVNFDFIPLISLVITFNLTSEDLNLHFKDREISDAVKAFLYCLQVAESAPDTFEFPWTWRIPSVLLNSPVDSKTPVIFNAGRILLARHFDIAPSFTKTNDTNEEACFGDLASFMEFFLNKHRPDLSFDFSIKLIDDCYQIKGKFIIRNELETET